MAEEEQKSRRWVIIAAIAVPLAAIAVLVVLELAAGPSRLDDEYVYGRPRFDAAEIPARVRDEVPLQVPSPADLSTGPDGNLYLACDGAIVVLDGSDPAREVKRIDTGRAAACLAVDGAGRIYTCAGRILRRLDAGGDEEMRTAAPGTRFRAADIAVSGGDVFVADCGTPAVLRFDAGGKLNGRIPANQENPSNGEFPGFVIPSPYMSLFVGDGGKLYVANTGKHRVEVFRPDGTYRRELSWGEFSNSSPAGFTGCCNPVSIAAFGTERVVTTEKGTPRVKLYGVGGGYKGLLLSAERLGPVSGGLIAACAKGRIFVLEPGGRTLHVIEPDPPALETAREGT